MKTKNIHLLLIFLGLSVLLIFVIQWNQAAQADQRAEQLINAYIEAKGLDISPETEAYANLLKGIYQGEYPDLTGENSTFIQNRWDRDTVIDYAARHMDEQGSHSQDPEAEETNA